MSEFCADHTKLVMDVGEIKGQNRILIEGQHAIKQSLDILAQNRTMDKAEAKILHERDTRKLDDASLPYKWAKRAAIATGGGIGILFIQTIFPKLLKALFSGMLP